MKSKRRQELVLLFHFDLQMFLTKLTLLVGQLGATLNGLEYEVPHEDWARIVKYILLTGVVFMVGSIVQSF